MAALANPAQAHADDDEEELSKDATPFNRLKYRNIGPHAGGRISRSAHADSGLLRDVPDLTYKLLVTLSKRVRMLEQAEQP